MLMRSSGLSRSASRWAFQVSASLGATLIAALVLQALPHAAPDPAAPAPEMTSGGKFAARVASARAYDGLDEMPLPHVDVPATAPTPSIVPAAFLSAPIDVAGLGAALREPADAAPSRLRSKAVRSARGPARAEALRRETPGGSAPGPVAEVATAPADDGLLHQVATRTRQVWTSTSATTREAWSATSSMGSALISRIVP